MAGAGAGAVWATCLVLFGGALLTGLPPVLWWGPSRADGRVSPAAGLSALLQGPSLRMLSAGLMLGSGLGVVVPEGFHAFAENAPPQHGGLPDWSAGASMLVGYVGMLALQLWLEGRQRPPHDLGAVAAPAAATAAGRTPGDVDGAGAAGCAVGDPPADDGGAGGGDGDVGGGSYSRSSMGWRQRREGGYSALPSTMGVDVEAARPAGASTAFAAGSGGMELSRRQGGAVTTSGGGGGGDLSSTPLLSIPPDGGRAVPPPPPPYSTYPSPSAAAEQPIAGTTTCTAVVTSAAAASGPDDSLSAKSAPAAAAATAAATAAAAGSSAPSLSSAQFALGGLLVHSAADGMAVGAASLGDAGGGGGGGGPSALTLAVVAAIMMHKLPVTLGLTTYLREAGWRRGRVLQALLAFSASAPLSALASFYLLDMILPASGGGGAAGGGQGVALAVLFSGGTFLAAATQHILPAALAATMAAAAPAPLAAPVAAPGDSCGAHGSASAAAAAAGSRKGSRVAGSEGASGGGAGSGSGLVSGSGRLLPLMWLAVGAAAPLLITALLPE